VKRGQNFNIERVRELKRANRLSSHSSVAAAPQLGTSSSGPTRNTSLAVTRRPTIAFQRPKHTPRDFSDDQYGLSFLDIPRKKVDSSTSMSKS
jgi:hypothetical protein